MFANVSTKKCPSGEVCTIARGEHAKISEESYLRFREVRVAASSQLEQLLNTKQLQQTTDASPALVLKLQRAVLASRAVSGEAQEILRKQGVTP